MPTIKSDAYGKTLVRLTYLDREHEPNEVRELSVDILFHGDFAAAYEKGDNASILPTDTMKNTVYVLAQQLSWNSIEIFGQGIAQHFLGLLPHLSDVVVDIKQVPWQQIGEHGTAFFQAGNERRITRLKASRTGVKISSGIQGLQILKTAHSSFAGFLKDPLTTLPETHDRLFGTVLEVEWQYLHNNLSFNESHREIRGMLLDCFARHKSASVQHTLFSMGQTVLNRVREVAEIRLVMPNKHYLLVDLSRFGLDNENRVFIPTEEPSGYIEALITR